MNALAQICICFRCPSPPKSLLWEDAFSKTEAGILYLNWPSSIGPQLKLNNIWFWPSEVSINQFLVIFFFYLKCLKSHFQVLEKKALLEEREHFFGGRNFPFHASNKNVDSFFNAEEIIRHHCQLLWKQVCCEKDKESQNHRRAEVGKGRSSCPTPLLKPDYPEQVAQHNVQMSCTSKVGDSQISLGNLCLSAVPFTVSWCSEGSSCVSVHAHYF